MATEDTKNWGAIARIDRTVEMPEDPTLRRAAVWWEVFATLPDEPASRVWATYVADVWEHALSVIEGLSASATWIDSGADEMRERVAAAKASYDAATSEWWGSSGDWCELEAEKNRRFLHFVVATQQRLVALMVEEGDVLASRVRTRVVHPYVAGYLSGLATNWCDASGIEVDDSRCQAEMRSMFGEVFGDHPDEAAMTIFFERWAGEVEFVDGMLHAHEDVGSFRRWERGIRIHPRMRLYEHLTA